MALEKFHYQTKYGEITATRFKDLPIGVVRKHRNDPGEAAFAMIESGLDEKSLTVFDKLSQEEFKAFQTAWMEDSKVVLGESSASSTS